MSHTVPWHICLPYYMWDMKTSSKSVFVQHWLGNVCTRKPAANKVKPHYCYKAFWTKINLNKKMFFSKLHDYVPDYVGYEDEL